MATIGLIAASQPADCEGGGGYGAGRFACEFRHPQRVHISQVHLKRYGDKRLIGKVKYHCREPVDAHTVHIALQRKTSTGGWREYVAADDNRIPPPSGKKLTARAVYVDCINGTWRSKVVVTAVYVGETSRSEPTYSTPAKVDCKD